MARLFFFACVVVSGLIISILMAKGFSPRDVPEPVTLGYVVWQNNGCVGCHSLYGQGGAYAPDLTHIYGQRGDGYLREVLVNPNAFHPDQRVMPRFGFTLNETNNLLAFLDWVDSQEEATVFPPRMILVNGSGNGVGQIDAVAASSGIVEDTPEARGRALFSRAPAICSTCHSLEPDIVIIGPSLYGVANRAGQRVSGLEAADYLRNSILHPSDYVVEGFNDVMQKNFADILSSQQIDDLIAFLLTLESAPNEN